ncbi:MAG TPA: peptide chain release factor N(5)-glutamine methyltransferase [Desulfitobacteriaceae bacterium]|nr:peptide chain release factor N(5)-glutamine methyltransferase [Desulfitobacteriaceae bacterium]
MKVLQLLCESTVLLEAAGVAGARFEADLLLASVLGLTRSELYCDFERFLTETEIRDCQGLVVRRQSREPLQYILQRQEFMGLDFYVDERVLIPRADSEILVEKLLELLDNDEGNASPRILDLCTGSGALAIAIASFRPQTKVVGTDLSAPALEVAAANAARLGVQVEWRQGDFLSPAEREQWDWIITNPPYVSAKDYQECQPEIFFEPDSAFRGGVDGLDFYRRLALEVPPLLKTGGRILMEIGWDQGRRVQEIFENQGYKTKVFPDIARRDRVVLVE